MNYLNEKTLIELKEKFKEFSFSYSEVDYFGKIPTFFIHVKCKEEIFALVWYKIVDFIAVNFQSSIEEEFSVWNIYLFFITEEQISDSLKYQIENDTFSSRKILIEGEHAYDKIIENHILNKDLTLKRKDRTVSNDVFIPNPIIGEFLQNKETKKRLSSEDREIFKKIIEKLTNNSNEI